MLYKYIKKEHFFATRKVKGSFKLPTLLPNLPLLPPARTYPSLYLQLKTFLLFHLFRFITIPYKPFSMDLCIKEKEGYRQNLSHLKEDCVLENEID